MCGRLDVSPSLGVEENRSNNRFQIAACSGSVVIERSGDASDVRRRRIARHEMLDKELAEERPNIRVIENIIERPFSES